MKNFYFNRTVGMYTQNPKLFMALLVFSFFSSAALLSPFINILFNFKPEVQDFSKHIMSNAAFNDFDVAARISLFYKTLIGFVGLSAGIFTFLYYRLRKAELFVNKARHSISLISNLSLLGLITVFGGFFQISTDLSVYFILLVTVYLLYNLAMTKTFWNADSAFWVVFVSFPFAVVAYQALLQKYGDFLYKKRYINDILIPVDVKDLVFIALLFLMSIPAYFFLRIKLKKCAGHEETEQKRALIFYSSLPLMFGLILQSLALEFFNIVNVRAGYVFNHPYVLFIFIVAVLLFWCLYRYRKSNHKYKVFRTNVMERYYYPLAIVTISLLCFQPWRMMQPENEFFEMANHGLSVDHFFRYGMIPIVETFDAHMLNYQMFAYAYGILNGYEPWAPFLYSDYLQIITMLTGFYILKNLIGSARALMVSLCFPFILVFFNQYIYCGLTALALLSLLNNRSTRNFYLLWASLLFLCVLRLDIGFAVLAASIIAYFTINFIMGRPLLIKKFVFTAMVSFGSMLLLFILLCVIKGINPVSRLQEFLIVAMSNQNWAYESLGDKTHMLFRMMYYVLPLLILLLLVITVFKTFLKPSHYINRENKSRFAALVFFIFFSLAFFINIPRGIVRHSFMSDIVTMIAGTSLPALVCFIFIKKRANNFLALLVLCLAFVLTVNIKKQNVQDQFRSYLSMGVNSGSFFEKFNDAPAFNGTRVRATFSLSEPYLFKDILDAVLTKDETYFDFASANYYYALVERKNPLYVNQSPLLLNGDKSQQMALEQLKRSGAPIAIMPKRGNLWSSIDGIPVEFKYYLISEYIFKNYTPMLQLASFDVYVLKDRKNKYDAILKSKNILSGKEQMASGFEDMPLNNIIKNSMQVEKENGKLVLIPAGPDPFICSFINAIDVKGGLNANLPVSIKINLEAAATGSVQLFYLMPNQDAWAEEYSKTYPVNAGINELTLDVPGFPKDLRIDVDGPVIKLNSLAFKNPGINTNSAPGLTDDDLGSIPLLWGEKSDEKLFSGIKEISVTETTSAIKSLSATTAVKPGYLFVEFESDTIQRASVALIDSKNEKKVGYTFTTKQGRHSYAIRVSPNYSWWNAAISKLTFNSSQPVKIYKFAFVSDDGKIILSGVENSLSLSNITDDNWYGGVGLKYNLFLFENSSFNKKKIRPQALLQLSDGRRVKIKSVNEAGNYLHVEIFENVGEYKDAAAYPNTIKVIN